MLQLQLQSTASSWREPFVVSVRDRVGQIQRSKIIYEFSRSDTKDHGSIALPGGIMRPLKPSELTALAQSNQCSDWSAVRLWMEHDDDIEVDRSSWLEQHVTFNTFQGTIVIATYSQQQQQNDDENHDTHHRTGSTSKSYKPAPGIHHNTLIENCIFERNCRVYRNAILTDTHVGANAVVLNNGQITASSHTVGAIELSVGPETGGGRKLAVQVESTMIDICQWMGISRLRQSAQTNTAATVPTESSSWNTIGNNCLIRDTHTVSNIYMAPHSNIEAATMVDHAVLLSHAQISHGATAKHVLLQWNASIVHQSHVSHTLLMECASAGPLSIVAESVLGPDVHVSAGEVHASVLGPNTNAHHQSLLIGVIWPLGRGNVGYGANVGSNHTGRLPDQECWSGEGTFWGLSTVVKFPVSMAPYTLVAAGTTVAPQRMEFPFSLLIETTILPGWVLSHSPYTLSRSETKFATRRKAHRHDAYTGWLILRPAMIDACRAARQALQSVEVSLLPQQPQPSSTKLSTATNINTHQYTERDIPGIGQFQLTEKARKSGVDAYTSCIRRYALSGLLEFYGLGGTTGTLEMDLAAAMSLSSLCDDSLLEQQHHHHMQDWTTPQWPVLPWEDQDRWNHQKQILVKEFPRNSSSFSMWIIQLLQQLVELEKDYANRVHSSKQRDDERGHQTIPTYSEAHVNAADDDIVVEARARADEVERTVASIISTHETDGIETTRSKL